MAKIEYIVKELKSLSSTVSQRIWTVSVGTLIFCLTFIVESIGSESEPFLAPIQVIGPIVLALLSVLADLAQYLAAYKLNLNMYDAMKNECLTELDYDKSDLYYKIRTKSYGVKIVCCFSGTTWLIFIMGQRVLELL